MAETPTLERRLSVSAASTLDAARQAADIWGGLWHPEDDGGWLVLPVTQGLRRGVVKGLLAAEASPSGCSIRLRIESRDVRLNRPAVVVLALGALGGLTTALWPLYPDLLRLAPAGAVLALVAWLLVASRLRWSGAEEFLDLVVDLAEPPASDTRAEPDR